MITERIIQTTEDGSSTIAIPALHITYHSKYGAIQESMHVFIQTGLKCLLNKNKIETLNILEVGYGTGLNALLSLNEAIQLKQKMFYNAIEPFPVSVDQAAGLNYVERINKNLENEFRLMHSCVFDEEIAVNRLFSLKKINTALETFNQNINFI